MPFNRRYSIDRVKIGPQGGGRKISAEPLSLGQFRLGVYLRKPLSKGDRVDVEFTFHDRRSGQSSETIAGTVRWVEPIGGSFAAGIKFDENACREFFPILSRCLKYC